jgi:hypothetical protein
MKLFVELDKHANHTQVPGSRAQDRAVESAAEGPIQLEKVFRH